jgi:hypothetical protein
MLKCSNSVRFEISKAEMSTPTRATRRYIPEDGIYYDTCVAARNLTLNVMVWKAPVPSVARMRGQKADSQSRVPRFQTSIQGQTADT